MNRTQEPQFFIWVSLIQSVKSIALEIWSGSRPSFEILVLFHSIGAYSSLVFVLFTLMDDQEVFPGANMGGELASSCSMDSFFDDLLKDTHACTHAHTCNPPGPDYSHTHTCFHVHTKILSSASEDKAGTDDTAESGEKKSKKQPLGNKVAVRKYREKEKARVKLLEDEVLNLRAENRRLVMRLQGQPALEAEIARLKCLLVDIRGRIEGEIGSFPYQKSVNPSLPNPNMPGAIFMNPCNVQCDDQLYCLHPGMDGKCGDGAVMNGQDFNGCGFESLQCFANQDGGAKELPDCGVGNGVSNVNSSGTSKRKRGTRAAAAN